MQPISIVELLSKLAEKTLRLETVNMAPDYHDNMEKYRVPHCSLKEIAHDGAGSYLLSVDSACFKLDSEGATSVQDRNEIVNLANIVKIIVC